MASSYSFRAELWLYPGEAGWHFLTLPVEVADDIREESAAFRKGFGSVKVTVQAGGQSWQTSIFPDARTGSYLLPVKKSVRAAAHLAAGDAMEVRLTVQPNPGP
ncbi:MAG: hypothetical protein K0R37_818 [Arthrobacter sp.]|nr:hypothetical protein [Arthrobacter sp.]